MRKVVINRCYGGFGLSLEAQKRYLEIKGQTPIFHNGKFSWEKRWYSKETPYLSVSGLERHDPILVRVVEELGERANVDCANLCIEEVDGRYRIEEYDGMESLEEEGGYSGWR